MSAAVKDMTNIQSQFLTATVLGALLIMTTMVSFHSQTTYAQTSSPQGKSNSSSGGTSSVPSSNNTVTAKDLSFNGKSVKILFVSSFFDKADWNNIDSIVSHGYDVKAVIPVQEPKALAYFVVLEAK
jgi:hypothetical protein